MIRLPANDDVDLLRACLGDLGAWRRWWPGHGPEAFKAHKRFSHLLGFLQAGLGAELGEFATVARAAAVREELRHGAFQEQAADLGARLFLDEFAMAETFHRPEIRRHCGFLAAFSCELPAGEWQLANGREGSQRWRAPGGLVVELHH
ncbi:MAG: hypothetical protein KC910_19845, partial [Candidatus Eremiobacteraeota bacterium]|nr:hypothetical protein [Candidatus Eremiobacteraeota bacterium]